MTPFLVDLPMPAAHSTKLQERKNYRYSVLLTLYNRWRVGKTRKESVIVK
jgi:hypothetical protein